MSASASRRCKDFGCENAPKGCMEHVYIKGKDARTRLTTRGPLKAYTGLWTSKTKSDKLPQNKTELKTLVGFVASCLACGDDPKAEGVKQLVGDATTMNYIFDRYLAFRRKEALLHGEAFNEVGSLKSAVKTSKAAFGAVPPTQLDLPKIERFIQGYVDQGYMAASGNDVLNRFVGPACKWAAGQRPPLMVNPFREYGEYRIEVNFNDREKRVPPELEGQLLAACVDFGTPWLADAIVLFIDLACREGELTALLNSDVDWETHTVLFPNTKRRRNKRGGGKRTTGENRRVPFNPTGRVAEVLKRGKFRLARPVIDVPGVGKNGGQETPARRAQLLYKAWCNLVLHVMGGVPRTFGMELPKPGTPLHTLLHDEDDGIDLHLHDLRHEAITWWGLRLVSSDSRKWLDGHASQFGTDGRYDHSKAHVALMELREKVWPVEHLRNVRSKSGPNLVPMTAKKA